MPGPGIVLEHDIAATSFGVRHGNSFTFSIERWKFMVLSFTFSIIYFRNLEVDFLKNLNFGNFNFSDLGENPHPEFQIFSIQQKKCGAGLGTQSELAPSSERAERRVDGPHVSIIIIQHHSIIMTVHGGDPEALEHQFAAKPFLLFFVPDWEIRGYTGTT